MNPIVGIGELLWDIYPDGRKVAGGAPFNFAFHCHQLGHPAVIVTRVGDDDLGRELRDEVKRLGLSDEFIQTDHDHPTGTVRVTLDGSGVPTYEIVENVAWDHLRWTPELDTLGAGSVAVCHGMLAIRSTHSRRTIDRLCTAGRAALRVLDVNLRQPRPDPDSVYQALTTAEWVKVNEEELDELARVFGYSPSVLTQVQYQLSGCDDTFWLVTRGPHGARIMSRGGVVLDEPAAPARVVDTVGAGDAFTAAMVCLHLEGRPLGDCARFAGHYAARVCEYQGATPRVDRAGVERAAFGSP